MFLFQFPSIYPLNLCFNRNREIFNILRQKNAGGCALKCILLLYLWGEYLQIFLNGFLQFKWVLNAFLDFAILVDDE